MVVDRVASDVVTSQSSPSSDIADALLGGAELSGVANWS